MDETAALAAFGALSNATRLRILKLLVKAGPDGMAAGDIAAASGAAPSRASFHLSALAETGLIAATRQARHIVYTVNFDVVGELTRYLLVECCANNATVRACCQ